MAEVSGPVGLVELVEQAGNSARDADVRNYAKTDAAIAAAGQGARSPLWGSRGEISPLRGATERRPARPEKGAQWRRKRFRKTALPTLSCGGAGGRPRLVVR